MAADKSCCAFAPEIAGIPVNSCRRGELAAHTALAPAPACTMNAALKQDTNKRTRADMAELRTACSPSVGRSRPK